MALQLCDLPEYLRDFQALDQQLIFISIGGAANIAEKLCNKLELKDYQQFPPQLQTIKRQNQNITFHLVQIDPALTEPPYVIQDDSLGFGHWQKEENIYTNEQNNINVYAFNEIVHYDDTFYEILGRLNKYVMLTDNILLVHDFCGRDTFVLAKHFEKQLEGHHNHIMYDITYQQQGSCVPDLLSQQNRISFYMEDNVLKFWNPFSIKLENFMDSYLLLDPIQKNILINTFKAKLDIMVREYYPFYRRFFLNLEVTREEYKFFTDKFFAYHFNCLETVVIDDIKEYDNRYKVFERIKKEFQDYLQYLCSVCTEPEVTYSYLDAVFYDDVYKWVNIFRETFKDEFKRRGIIL